MSTRTDQARRLELSQVQEAGDLVTGRARGFAVSLEGEAPFTACLVELGASIPIARMVMRAGDLNQPDAVETGDGAFDERMQVTSLATYAPTLQQLLAAPELRSALLAFFTRHPDAEFVGARLRVPAGEDGATQALIGEALAIAERVAERFAQVGFLQDEPRATLPKKAPSSWSWPRSAIGALTTGLFYVAATSGLEMGMDPVRLMFGAMVVGLGALAGSNGIGGKK